MQTVLQSITLVDQDARDRFIQEIQSNFSVIAPAGVGKTTAIVGRILSIIDDPQHFEAIVSGKLKQIVVTYTQKAAEEMQQRARNELIKREAKYTAFEALNKIYFGTIHSFCLNLIQNFGPLIGISGDLQITTNEDLLWYEYLRNNELKFNSSKLEQFVNIADIIEIGRKLNPNLQLQHILTEPPIPDITKLINYKPKTSHAQKSIDEGIAIAKQWIQSYQKNKKVLGIPSFSKGGEEFVTLWSETFLPLWKWLSNASLNLASIIAKSYQQFRIDKGIINYADIISLAHRIVTDTRLTHLLGNNSVILDEAQDTDEEQFHILTKIADAKFSMVGDPQQSIYSSRADVSTYLKIHESLTHQENFGKELMFQVTMRCNHQIVQHANRIFPNILKHHYVELKPRPWAENGKVQKLKLKLQETTEKKGIQEKENEEVLALTTWIKNYGLTGFEINDWHELAILAPRKSWLIAIAKTLENIGIPAQLHSLDEKMKDNPVFAWITGLVTVIADPLNAFEINGVLREVFGLSDGNIANYVKKHFKPEEIHPLNLIHPISDQSKVFESLNQLKNIRDIVSTLPSSQALERIIQMSKCREKLMALPDFEPKFIEKSLEAIIVKANEISENAEGLQGFVNYLQENYNNEADALPEIKGHVQLYTSHKAKGLEWPAVIIPYMFRSIEYPTDTYPQVLKLSHKEVLIAPCPHEGKRIYDTKITNSRKAELERLLYVSITRAKNRLFYVDDKDLFGEKSTSFGTLMQFGFEQENFNTWQDLDTTEIEKNESEKKIQKKEISKIIKLKQKKILDLHPKFPKRKTPSSLIQYASKEEKKETINENALAYGNWWHQTMQNMPWHQNTKSYIDSSIQNSPCPTLAQEELEKLQNTNLFNQLTTMKVWTEVPFFARLQEDAYEGVVDLIAYDEPKDSYIVLDWKTDALENPNELLTHYGKQIEVYRQILATQTQKPVQAFIYHTKTAKLLISQGNHHQTNINRINSTNSTCLT